MPRFDSPTDMTAVTGSQRNTRRTRRKELNVIRLKHLSTRMVILIVTALLLIASSIVVWSADTDVKAGINPTLVDSRNRTVGTVIDVAGGSVTALIDFGGSPIAVNTNGGILAGAGNVASTNLLFESADCTGQPFGNQSASQDPTEIMRLFFIVGTRLYTSAGEMRAVEFNSVMNQDGTFCEQDQGTQDGAPVQATGLDLAVEFQPPFRIRFRD